MEKRRRFLPEEWRLPEPPPFPFPQEGGFPPPPFGDQELPRPPKLSQVVRRVEKEIEKGRGEFWELIEEVRSLRRTMVKKIGGD